MEFFSGQPEAGPAPEARPPTEFHHFPDLPTELRQLVWKQAAQLKRVVVLHTPPHDSNAVYARVRLGHSTRVTAAVGTSYGPFVLHPLPPLLTTTAGDLRRLGWTSPTPPPGMLLACTEARTVALESYSLAFGWLGLPPCVRINFDRDDVVVTPGDCLGGSPWIGNQLPRYQFVQKAWVTTPDVEKIQRVIVCGGINERHKCWFSALSKQSFPLDSSLNWPWPRHWKSLKALESWTDVAVEDRYPEPRVCGMLPVLVKNWGVCREVLRRVGKKMMRIEVEEPVRQPLLVYDGNSCFVTQCRLPERQVAEGEFEAGVYRRGLLSISVTLYGGDTAVEDVWALWTLRNVQPSGGQCFHRTGQCEGPCVPRSVQHRSKDLKRAVLKVEGIGMRLLHHP